MSSSNKVVTNEGTFSYVTIWQSRGFRNADGSTGDPKYSIALVIPKTEDVSAINAAHAMVVAADFPDGMPFNSRTGAGVNSVGALMDGAVRYPTDPFYADKWILSASADEEHFSHEHVVDQSNGMQQIVNKSELYSGAKGKLHISFYGFQGGSKGVSCALHGIMKTGDGESLGGGIVDSTSAFAEASGQTPAPQTAPPVHKPANASPAPTPPPQAPIPTSAPIAPPAHMMTPAANGFTYEQMLAEGWTDESLVSGGMMVG